MSEMQKVRTAIKSQPRLDLELKAKISEVLRQHGVDIGDGELAEVVLAVPDELCATTAVVLPAPGLPPV